MKKLLLAAAVCLIFTACPQPGSSPENPSTGTVAGNGGTPSDTEPAALFDRETLSLTFNETALLTLNVTPPQPQTAVVWSSSDETIAVVSNGTVTAGVQPGYTLVSAAVEGIPVPAVCRVSVGVLEISSSEIPNSEILKQHTVNGRLVISGTAGDTAVLETVARYAASDPDFISLDISGISDITELRADSGVSFRDSFLKEVRLPQNLTLLEGVFAGCTALETVGEAPELKALRGAFAGCRSLRSLADMPVLEELNEAFRDSGLSEFKNDSVRLLRKRTFAGCGDLTKVILPNASHLHSELFDGCSRLERIELTSEIFTFVSSFDNGEGGSHYDPFSALPDRGQVTLYLHAGQKKNIVSDSGRCLWSPVTRDADGTGSGLEVPVDLSGFAAVYCGEEAVYIYRSTAG